MGIPIPAAAPPPAAASLGQLFAAFLRLGASAFGGPAMVVYIRRLAVEKRGWLTPDAFDDGVALCQVIPGATALQTAAYVGLRIRGVTGAAVTFVAFALPSFLLMLALSAAYSRAHELPLVASTFGGLRAMIVALVAHAAVSFGTSTLRRPVHFAIALGAAALFGAHVSPLAVIALAAAAGWAWLRPAAPNAIAGAAGSALSSTTRQVVSIGTVAALALAAVAILDRQLATLFALMVRVDLFAFGGGFASIPLLYHELVEVRHWLTGPVLLDGIALGQVTPGPIVITAAFVGHQLAGAVGGAVATTGMLLPSFLMVVGVGPHFDRLRQSTAFVRIIGGVLCSFVGLLLAVAVRFGLEVDWTWAHALVAAAVFVALRCRIDVLWVVGGGVVLSLLLCR